MERQSSKCGGLGADSPTRVDLMRVNRQGTANSSTYTTI